MPATRKQPRYRTVLLVLLALVGLAVVVFQERRTEPTPPGGGDLTEVAAEALRTLDTLPVKGRAPRTGYSRDLFGPAWTDSVTVQGGGNSCDTRNDILARDLTDVEYRDDGRECTVIAGLLDDPFTGKQIYFERGVESSGAVQIDHIVALSDAWQKGAQQLDEQERRNFANDPRNLQATDGPTNQAKSDSDAASWLPPNHSYRCTYVARQIEVKAAYRLWVTQAERDAMVQVLQGCVQPDVPPLTSAPPRTDLPPITNVPG